MKINQKIIMGFLVVALLILAVSYICLTTQANLAKRFQEVAGEVLPGTITEAMMQASLHNTVELMEEYASSGNVSDREKTEDALLTLGEYMAAHRLYHSGYDTSASLNMTDETIERFASFIMEYILKKDKGASKEELGIVRAKIDQVVNVFISQVEPTIRVHIKTAREAAKATTQRITHARKFILGSSAAIFSLAIVLGFFISRLISKPIRELSEAAGRIGKGQLDIQIEPVSKDEIGQLAISFNRMSKDLQMITVSRDTFASEVVERKKAAEALKKSEDKLAGIVDSVTDAMIMVDDQFNVVWNNDIAIEIFGADMVGKKCYSAYHGRNEICKPCIVKSCFNDGKVHEFETEIVGTDGNRMSLWGTAGVAAIDEEGRPKMVVEFLRDITERSLAEGKKEKLEAQLLQAQKMEAIGSLAGGIAHDFNNILQVILGYTELLEVNKKAKDSENGYLGAIKKSALRATEMTKQLLIFSRKVESELKPVSLNQEVIKDQSLLRRTIPQMINIELNLAENPYIINADPVQIGQIIMNLAINARDAMPDGGKLIFETKNIILDEEYCKVNLEAVPGKYVLLSVSDTGHGMDKDTLGHIFEPFYTTKEIGEGTGLGLSMVYGIVKSHGGYITCDSKPGHGTVFNIYFPALETDNVVKGEELKNRAEIHGGHETILLVDDVESILDLGQYMLSPYGYKTIRAENGEDALKIYETEKDRINLVILDIDMPGIGGGKCLQELLKINSGIKVIIASGYTGSIKIKEYIEYGAAGYVCKPYRLEDMIKKVREVLDNN